MGCSVSASDAEFHSKYAIGDKIGRGAFAQVHLARKRRNTKADEVVVKIVDVRSRNSTKKSLNSCLAAFSEACVSSYVGTHRHCVGMRECWFDDHLCYMVLEKCSKALTEYITEWKEISEKTLAEAFDQMLHGISHVHSRRIVHQDIKPQNFLVGGSNGQTIKLADFGLSFYVPEGKKVIRMGGTAPYMCPEMLRGEGQDLSCDMWSFGVVAYLFLCGQFPCSIDSSSCPTADSYSKALKDNIAYGGPPECDKPWLSKEAISFLTNLLQRSPDARSSADSALKMPFITKRCQSSALLQPYESQSLQPIFRRAVKTRALDTPRISSKSRIDDTLERLQMGKLQSNTSVLTQQHINEFIGATRSTIKTVETLWPDLDMKPQPEESVSSKSTTCTSFKSTICTSFPSSSTNTS